MTNIILLILKYCWRRLSFQVYCLISSRRNTVSATMCRDTFGVTHTQGENLQFCWEIAVQFVFHNSVSWKVSRVTTSTQSSKIYTVVCQREKQSKDTKSPAMYSVAGHFPSLGWLFPNITTDPTSILEGGKLLSHPFFCVLFKKK